MRKLLSRSTVAAALGALAFAGSCKEATSVPDLNNLPASTIANGFTPSTFQLVTTGLLNQDRGNVTFSYIVFMETMARDVYNLDPSEARFITEILGNQIDPGGFAAGNFLGPYNAVSTANTLLAGIGSLATYSAAQQSAVRGLVQTIKALQLYRVFELRGPNGVVADAGPISAPLQPLLCQTSALARISALLDSGYTNLQNGGTDFPITLPAGFTAHGNFATVSGFAQFNRGLKGKVEVYRGILGQSQSYADAITALNASFLNTSGDLTSGIYYEYSTAANEQVNPLAAATIYLNPLVGTRIAANDQRASKIDTIATVRKLNGVSTKFKSPLAATSNLTGEIPLLRNAELVLLRAQAEIGAGQLDAATADINAVRTVEGGLPKYSTFTDPSLAIGAVLYEKQYSLLLTGAQRLVDLRSYGYLNANGYVAPAGSYTNLSGGRFTFPQEQGALDLYLSAIPLPKAEADARKNNITPACG